MSDQLKIAHHIQRIAREAVNDKEITLDYDARFLRRKRLVSDDGEAFLVDLPTTTSLNDGDAFLLKDGQQIIVRAAIEPLLEIRHENLPKIAWHIGNRHTPCEIMPDHLRIRHDHVLMDLMVKLGAKVTEIAAPFQPEGGAYGFGRTHEHAH